MHFSCVTNKYFVREGNTKERTFTVVVYRFGFLRMGPSDGKGMRQVA